MAIAAEGFKVSLLNLTGSDSVWFVWSKRTAIPGWSPEFMKAAELNALMTEGLFSTFSTMAGMSAVGQVTPWMVMYGTVALYSLEPVVKLLGFTTWRQAPASLADVLFSQAMAAGAGVAGRRAVLPGYGGKRCSLGDILADERHAVLRPTPAPELCSWVSGRRRGGPAQLGRRLLVERAFEDRRGDEIRNDQEESKAHEQQCPLVVLLTSFRLLRRAFRCQAWRLLLLGILQPREAPFHGPPVGCELAHFVHDGTSSDG